MSKSNNKKLWSGRFTKKSAKLLSEFNDSFSFDKRLYKQDIEASKAYAQALAKAKVISPKESKQITKGLEKIQKEIKANNHKWFEKNKNEDIHTAIESRLVKLIGNTANKLHTGRSRNDQVVTDLRLWLKEEIKEIIQLIKKLRATLIILARKHYKTILPGYTHLQVAQPITLGHYFLAYVQKLSRDLERFAQTLQRVNVLPLGSGALAGTSFPIDRKYIASKLKFEKITENSIDAVSDRDFIVECLFNISLLNIHLSHWAEEVISWNSEEFKFISISDSYATGSSMMPQKKNPDVPELIRGKSGRFTGNLLSMLTLLKGLPLAYNKDLQEDKGLIFDSIDNIRVVLRVTNEFLQNVSFNKDKMYQAASHGFSNATDVADYLTKKGIPFRKAHETVGKIVLYCLKKQKQFKDLSFDEWRSFHKMFSGDIIEKTKIESCINSKKTYGGTAPKEVLKALKRAAKLKV